LYKAFHLTADLLASSIVMVGEALAL